MAQPLFDPRSLPVDAVAGEAALAPERLTPHWLRHTRGMNILRRSRSTNALKVAQRALGHASLASTGLAAYRGRMLTYTRQG